MALAKSLNDVRLRSRLTLKGPPHGEHYGSKINRSSGGRVAAEIHIEPPQWREHLNEALKLAKTVAAQAPLAVRVAKESVLAAFETPLEDGLALERKNFFLLFATEDMREGMQAFIEKRKADFQGR